MLQYYEYIENWVENFNLQIYVQHSMKKYIQANLTKKC